MSIAKLKIDLAHGVIDAEGSEEFVLSVYRDFKEKLDGLRQAPSVNTQHTQSNTTQNIQETPPKKYASSGQKGKKTGKTNPSFVKDLDLSGGGKFERLKDFYSKYEAKSNLDKNLIFLYYLQHKIGMSGINTDHVFSCYREVGSKVPEALRQSLIDTANRKGWIDTSNTEDIKVSISGVNFIEHDMQKKGSEA